jgi:hypothetical protein
MNAGTVRKNTVKIINGAVLGKGLAVKILCTINALEGAVGVLRNRNAYALAMILINVLSIVEEIINAVVIENLGCPIVVERPGLGIVGLKCNANIFPVGHILGTPALEAVTLNKVTCTVCVEVTLLLAFLNVNYGGVSYGEIKLVQIVKILVVIVIVIGVILIGGIAEFAGYSCFPVIALEQKAARGGEKYT